MVSIMSHGYTPCGMDFSLHMKWEHITKSIGILGGNANCLIEVVNVANMFIDRNRKTRGF